MPIANIGPILASNAQIGGDAIETAVAKAFLVKHVDDYDRVAFAVKLGPGVDIGNTFPPNIQYMAQQNSRLRADMICWRGDVPTIVEVKDRAYPAVLGQLLTYARLLKQDNPKILQLYKVVACRSIVDGLETGLFEHGITVELFNVDVPAPAAT